MSGRTCSLWLTVLAGLFAVRVLAQAVQAVYPLPGLPPFDAWHGAVLPYPVLLASQVAVFALLVAVIWRVRADVIDPARWKFRICFGLGGAYFAFMAFRLIGGLTVLAGHPWFAKPLPAVFHLVLAAFILLFGHYLYARHKRSSTAMPDAAAAGLADGG